MKTIEQNPRFNYFLGMLLLLLLLIYAARCSAQTQQAQLDTVLCKVNCIDKFIEAPTANGKSTRIFAVYNDEAEGISELIPVSKTVYQYIKMCKDNNLKPSLGIKLRNGQISGIIRYKKTYVKRNKYGKR